MKKMLMIKVCQILSCKNILYATIFVEKTRDCRYA